MSNYNILQLNAKELSELKDIATELGLKVSGSAKKETLVYDILDQQAIVNAQRKTTIEKPDLDRKKRLRVPVKKGDQKVFTTNNEATKQAPKPDVKATPTEKPEISEAVVKAPEATEQTAQAPAQKKNPKANRKNRLKNRL